MARAAAIATAEGEARLRPGGRTSERGALPARGSRGPKAGQHPIPGARPTGLWRRGPSGARGWPAHGSRPPVLCGWGRGARLRSPSGVQALADSALSRPERKAAVTVTR